MKEILIAADNVIEIILSDKSPSIEYAYVKPVTIKKFSWSKLSYVEKTIEGYYRNYYGDKVDPREIVEKKSNYVLLKTHELAEGPLGTVFVRPNILVVSVGGKYTTKNEYWFDTYDEAKKVVDEIKNKYPDKFLIINK
jgi:hypothetical protein